MAPWAARKRLVRRGASGKFAGATALSRSGLAGDQLQGDGADGNLHPNANLHRQPPPVVADPHMEMRRPPIEHIVEQINLIPDCFERTLRRFDVLALLGLDFGENALLP